MSVLAWQRHCGAWRQLWRQHRAAWRQLWQQLWQQHRGAWRQLWQLLWDVDYQVIVSVQGIIPAAGVTEHLLRDGAQDRVWGHLGRRQGG